MQVTTTWREPPLCLVSDASCKATFDADINSWDVSQVTSVSVSLPAESGWGGGAWIGGEAGLTLTPQSAPPTGKCLVCHGAAQNMFAQASAFNQPLNLWDVSKVRNMEVRPPHTPVWRGGYQGIRGERRLAQPGVHHARAHGMRVVARRSTYFGMRAPSTSR